MKCYKSKWIITAAGEVLEDFALVVDEEKIVDIIPHSDINFDKKNIKDFGNSVITPGFIDLLTQFQYTDTGIVKPKNFKNKLKKLFKTISLKWIFAGVDRQVYSFKWAKILTDYFTLDRTEKIESYKHGLTESIKAGTTCIAQVSKEYKYFELINKLPIKSYLFFEVYADTSDKSKKKFKSLRNKVEELILHKGENTHIGIMLNSISGVHKKLWALFSKYGRKHNMLIMTRFAESIDEIDWLNHGFSDIDLLHKFLNLRKISPYMKEVSPVEYLENLKVLSKKVITVNANYLNEEELEKLAQTGVKYVYQPYYSEEICNKKLPFSEVLKYFKGNFGFSTQSFAKEKNYSLLKEAVEMNQGILDIEELIKYLTIYPAKILRLENSTGSLETGKDADFNVFSLQENQSYADIAQNYMPQSVYSKGRKLIKNGGVNFAL